MVPTPSSPGNKSATLEIQSHDPDENPFTLSLAGRQATATDLWRQTHFGSMDEKGAASDQSDPDADGIPNLVEFALGSHPKEPPPAPGTLVRNGSTPAGTRRTSLRPPPRHPPVADHTCAASSIPLPSHTESPKTMHCPEGNFSA